MSHEEQDPERSAEAVRPAVALGGVLYGRVPVTVDSATGLQLDNKPTEHFKNNSLDFVCVCVCVCVCV